MSEATHPTQIQTVYQSDGIIRERMAFFAEVFRRAKADNLKLNVHTQSLGQIALWNKPRVEEVTETSVTLSGSAICPLGPNQATKETGRCFVPLHDVVRVFEVSDVELASTMPPTPSRGPLA